MQGLHIAFVSPIPFIPGRGGVERVTVLLTQELMRRGHKVFYIHAMDADEDPDGSPATEVVRFPEKLYTKAPLTPANRAFYEDYLKSRRIDVIINPWGLYRRSVAMLRMPKNAQGRPVTISVLHNRPILNYDHLFGELMQVPKTGLTKAYKMLTRFLLYPWLKVRYRLNRRRELNMVACASDALCLLSPRSYGDFRRLGLDPVQQLPVRSIANPCSFTPAGMPAKKKQLLHVGRLETCQKASGRLIPIWKKLCMRFPDWEMVIVGDGPARAGMERAARGLPRIRFEGRRDPRPYYRDAALFCLPSTYEGMPMVLIETMVYGTVPVAFNSFPVLEDMVTHGQEGLLVPPFDLSAYAESLATLMSNEERRRTMAEACLKRAQQYSLPHIADQWEALFAELLEKPRKMGESLRSEVP